MYQGRSPSPNTEKRTVAPLFDLIALAKILTDGPGQHLTLMWGHCSVHTLASHLQIGRKSQSNPPNVTQPSSRLVPPPADRTPLDPCGRGLQSTPFSNRPARPPGVFQKTPAVPDDPPAGGWGVAGYRVRTKTMSPAAGLVVRLGDFLVPMKHSEGLAEPLKRLPPTGGSMMG